MFKKLRTRIIVWMMALALVVALGLGTATAANSYAAALQQMDEAVATSATNCGMALENYLESLQQQITSLAVSGGLTNTALTYEQRQANLHALLLSRPDLSGAYTIGADGVSINDSDYLLDDSSGEDYSEEDFFLSAFAAEGVWMDQPTYDGWTDNITLTVTTRYNDGAGFNGVVGMDVHYDVLLGIIQESAIGRTGYSVMMASDGLFITHPDAQYVLDGVNYLEDAGGEEEMADALRQALDGTEGQVSGVHYQGEEVLLHYQPIAGTDWTLVSVAKPAEFMDQFITTLSITVMSLASCLVIAIVMAVLVARSIARPVSQMSARMRQFAEGDLHTAMPTVKSRDELGVLHGALNDSVQTLDGYVSDISRHLQAIAEGNISGEVELEYAGDFAPIKDSLQRILVSLNGTMGEVNEAADQVGMNAAQMAHAAQSLSDSAIQQAGTLDQLSITFGEIKQGLQDTAESTTTTLEKTSGASKALTGSRASMDNMVRAMKQIEESAGSIEKIIKTIDDIAFQTNILALNAAVEAARAGQHGKGFAVVADEVRSLAGKSADSAQQTAQLIQSALAAVHTGSVTADETAEQLNGLEVLVNDAAELVRQIEDGANRQAQEAASIYDGIEQLNGMVQSNSAMAEETASASQEMDVRASQLRQALAFFTLGEQNQPPRLEG